ncbi:MAG: ATP-binding protein, partial [Verrucomicrobiota bacterium]
LAAAVTGLATERKARRPVRRLTESVRNMTGASLEARIPTPSDTEDLDELIQMINHMLERIEHSFNRSRRFTADVSHELKTPLSVLYGQVDLALQSSRDEDPEQQKLYAGLLSQIERLIDIVEKLLLLSRADAGALRLKRKDVRLSELVECLSDDIKCLDEGVTVEADVEPGLVLHGDQTLLQEVFCNLGYNAVKYSTGDRRITINLRRHRTTAHFTIANPARGISLEDGPRMFERFFRLEDSRCREQGGSGLGLSITREIVLAHQGRIDYDGSRSGLAVFHVVLPLQPPEGEPPPPSATPV